MRVSREGRGILPPFTHPSRGDSFLCTPMALPLQDRVVLVTGGARGIGLGIAEAAVEAGATVVLGDLDPAVEDAAARVAASGGRALGLRLDVTDATSIETAIARALDA